MRSQRTSRPASSPAEEAATIQVTTLYEDLESGIRAKAMMECVQAASTLLAKIKLRLWRFDWLREHSMWSQAMCAARSSTLLVISTSSAGSLSVEMENWLANWMQGRGDQTSALIVLIPQQRDNQSEHRKLHERMESVAQQKQIGFFCECFQRPFAAEEFHLTSRPDFWKPNTADPKSIERVRCPLPPPLLFQPATPPATRDESIPP